MNDNTLKEEALKWVLIDFDKTICTNTGFPDFIPLEVIDGFREACKSIIDKGYKPGIFTARSWSEYNIVEDWLVKQDIPIKRIICGKPLCKWLIDDRAIGFRNNWSEIIDQL